MTVHRLDAHVPDLDPTAWVAPGAQVVGRVTIGAEASVWFNAVVRADVEAVRIGARSNIQDGAVLHADPGFPAEIDDAVTIGHRAIVHGATVGEGCLVGMGAVLLNGAVLGAECLVGAGALVTEGKRFDAGLLIVGAPARAVRALSAEERARLRGSAAVYVANAARYRAGLAEA